MPYVRVKQKYQVTIPTALRQAIGLHEGDTLDARAENGRIILTPQEVRARTTEKIGLGAMIGAGKHCKSFNSAEEVDTYIDKMRSEWT